MSHEYDCARSSSEMSCSLQLGKKINLFSDTVHSPYFLGRQWKDCDNLQFTFIVVCQFRKINKIFRLQCSRMVKILLYYLFFKWNILLSHSRYKSMFLNFNFISACSALDIPILQRKRRKTDSFILENKITCPTLIIWCLCYSNNKEKGLTLNWNP